MSKRLIVVSILMLLVSACSSQFTVLTPQAEEVQNTQPVPLDALESISIATATPLFFTATEQPLPTLDFACPDAPTPRVHVNQQVTVVADDFNKLKLRSERKILPGTVKRDLDKFTQLRILEGPYCVYSAETTTSYWFYWAEVIPTGEIGWVAEGDSSHYFIEMTSEQPLPTLEAICLGAPAPHVAIGQQVTVVVDDTDKLKLRFQPKVSPDTVRMELDKFTQLRILEGPVCAYSDDAQTSYWFWMVAVFPDGEQGWVAEGDLLHYFIE